MCSILSGVADEKLADVALIANYERERCMSSLGRRADSAQCGAVVLLCDSEAIHEGKRAHLRFQLQAENGSVTVMTR